MGIFALANEIMEKEKEKKGMSGPTFWDHLEEMRWMLLRCICVIVLASVAVFCLKDWVFECIVLAPRTDDFITYRCLCRCAEMLGLPSLCPHTGEIGLINIDLAAQLFVHIRVSFCLAALLAVPYVAAECWFFVSPALYAKEKVPAIKAVLCFILLFFVGVSLAYFVIFPFTLQFLGTYQVSPDVINRISLDSYISTFLGLLFVFGLVFEMPVVAYFFSQVGVLNSALLSKFRKMAFVLSLVAAAAITPSTDVFTMMLVALPLQGLYEFSRLVVKRVEKKKM